MPAIGNFSISLLDRYKHSQTPMLIIFTVWQGIMPGEKILADVWGVEFVEPERIEVEDEQEN